PPSAASLEAELSFLGFLERLAVDAERGDGPRLQPLDADVAAALLALAVRAVLDAADCLVDLRHELALAVADAEQQVAVVFERGAVGRIGERLARLTHAVERANRLVQQLLPATQKQGPELTQISFPHYRHQMMGSESLDAVPPDRGRRN